MKLSEVPLLDWMVAEEPCLGAAFCTYNFDPIFFEEQVLRAVLKLRSDPEEQAFAFHDEARAGLQATPVAVLADARVSRSGRRLPYDLLLVRSRTFHPKLALILHESHARVVIGSSNLSRSGYQENVEMAFHRELHYDRPADAHTLRELDRFLESSLGLVPRAGTQMQLVQEALRARLPPPPPKPPELEYQIVHGYGGAILDRLFELVPQDAVVTRVGVLAPFFERDDEQVSQTEGLGSLLPALMAQRRSQDATLDIGVTWSDAPLSAYAEPVIPLEAAFGTLWAWRFTEDADGGERERIEYLVPKSMGPKWLSYQDAHGKALRWEREVTMDAVEKRRFWRVRPPTVRLPAAIVTHLRERFTTQIWLHPSTSLDERGRVVRRELHAKLLLIATERWGAERTYVLMGSPNASRAALLRGVEQGGNVELAVAAALDGAHKLADFLPSLVLAPHEDIQMTEATYAESGPDPRAWILDVVHDASAKDLTVEWATEASAPLGPWSLDYQTTECARGETVPIEPTRVFPFELSPSSAELTLHAHGRQWSIPIRVADLAQLPVTPGLEALGLRELLALLGRRVGAERLSTVLAQRGRIAADSMLEAIFGEGFGPVDVFKAWWGLASDLEQPLSLPAFRQRLVGPLGATAVWTRLRDEGHERLGTDEVWVYGCELLLCLRAAGLPDGADRAAKVSLLEATCAAIDADLTALRPHAERPWLDAVTAFYARAVPRA